MATRSIEQLQARIDALEQACAEMYQVAGAIGAPVRVLDQLAAAAAGKPLPLETVLPFDDAECSPVPTISEAAAALGRRNRGVTSRRKANASRLNGARGGRHAKFAAGDQVVTKASAPAAIRGRTGVVIRRATDRAAFLVRFTGEKKAAQVRSWWIEKEAF